MTKPGTFTCPEGEHLDLSATGPLFKKYANAKRVTAFNKLAKVARIHDIPGQPTVAEKMAPWLLDAIRFIVCCIGKDDDGVYRSAVTQALMLVPKKSGKTSGAAFLLIAWALFSVRKSAKILMMSAELQAVDTMFRAASGMIAATDELVPLFEVKAYRKSILCIQNDTLIECKAYAPAAVQGCLASLILIDELSLVGKIRDSIPTYQEAVGAVSITERCVVALTTHDTETPQGIWKVWLEQARRVAAGEESVPGFLPILWEAPAPIRAMMLEDFLKDIPLVKATIAASNPSIGYSIPTVEDLHASFKKTFTQGAEAVSSWLAKHANVQAKDFIGADNSWPWGKYVTDCMAPACDWRELPPAVRRFLVIDSGGNTDACALTLAVEDGAGIWHTWSHCFVFELALTNDKKIAARLQDAADAGELTIMPDSSQLAPVFDLAADIIRACDGDLVLVLDGGARALLPGDTWAAPLEAAGLPPQNIFRAPRGTATMAGAEQLGRWLAAKAIVMHGGALLPWMFGNLAVGNRGFLEKADAGHGDHALIDAAITHIFVGHAFMNAPRPSLAAFCFD